MTRLSNSGMPMRGPGQDKNDLTVPFTGNEKQVNQLPELPQGKYYFGPQNVVVSDKFLRNQEVQRVWKNRGINVYKPMNDVEQVTINRGGRDYFEDPQRVARLRDWIRTQPPGTQLPDYIDPEKVETAYNILKYRNGGQPWTAWGALDKQDPLRDYLRSIPGPDNTIMPYGPSPEEMQRDIIESNVKPITDPKTWKDLTPTQRAWLTLTAPNSGLKGRPEWSRGVASGTLGLISGLGGGAVGGGIGAVIGGVVGAAAGGVGAIPGAAAGAKIGGTIGGLVGVGGSIYQNYTEQEVPLLNDVLEVMDWLAIGTERAFGLKELNKVKDYQEISANFQAAWRAGDVAYESGFGKEVANFLIPKTSALIDPLFGYDPVRAPEDGEIYDLLAGEKDPVKVAGARYGTEAQYATLEAYERILEQPDQWREVVLDVQERYKFSGALGDLIVQSIADPANFIPFLGAKIGKQWGKYTNDPQMIQAFAQADGSPFIDALPPGIQEVVSWATGIKGSEGFFQGLKNYQQLIQQGYNVPGQPVIPAAQLSRAKKMIAALTETGELMELQPQQRAGLVLGQLTPEAKAAIYANNAVNIVNALMAAADDPGEIIELLNNFVGVDSMDTRVAQGLTDVKASLEPMNTSPIAETVRAGVKDAVTSTGMTNLFESWINTEQIRNKLIELSTAMDITTGQFLENLETNPEIFARQVSEVTGIPSTAENLREVFAPFLGKDFMPFTMDDFKARVGAILDTKLGDYLGPRYNLGSQSSFFKFMSMMKTAQSFLLLNSPSYVLNNQINNVITLANDGIINMMSHKQMDALAERFGFESADQYGRGEEIVRGETRTNQGMDKLLNQVRGAADKLAVFQTISNRLEALEGRRARIAGAMQYWNNIWKPGKGFREMPASTSAILESVRPGMTERVYDVIRSGMNMEEIMQRINTGDFRPSVKNMVDRVSKRMMPDNPDGLTGLFNETGLTEKLQDLIDQGLPFDKAADIVQDQAQTYIDQIHRKQLIERAQRHMEQVQDDATVSPQAVFSVYGDAEIEMARAHIRMRMEWDKLYQNYRKYSKEEWRRMTASLSARQNTEWRRIFENETQTVKGIIQAFGLDNKDSRAYVVELENIHNTWKEFYEFANKERRKVLQTEYATYEESVAAWEKLEALLMEEYNRSTEQERTAQIRMSNHFASMFEQATGWNKAYAQEIRRAILDMRREMVELQKAQREKTKGMGVLEKNVMYRPFNPEYNALIMQIKLLEQKGGIALSKNLFGKANITPEALQSMTWQQIIDKVDKLLEAERVDDLDTFSQISEEAANEAAENVAVLEEQQQVRTDEQRQEQQKTLDEANAEVELATEPETIADQVLAEERQKKERENLEAARQYGITNKNGEPVKPYALNVLNKWLEENGRDRVSSLGDVSIEDAIRSYEAHEQRHAIDKVKETIKTVITAADIFTEADRQVREAKIRDAGMQNRQELVDYLNKEFSGFTPQEHKAAIAALDAHADRWARGLGLIPSDSTRDAWYATRLAEGDYQKPIDPNSQRLYQQARRIAELDEAARSVEGTEIRYQRALGDYEAALSKYESNPRIEQYLRDVAKYGLRDIGLYDVDTASLHAAYEFHYANIDKTFIDWYGHAFDPFSRADVARMDALNHKGFTFNDYVVQEGWGRYSVSWRWNDSREVQKRTFSTQADAEKYLNLLKTQDFPPSDNIYDDWGDWENDTRRGDEVFDWDKLFPARGTLIALHNLTESDFRGADKLGGFPVPSIAITKASIPFTKYGEITLVGNRNMIDPANYLNKVYDADAYSITKPPTVWKKVKSARVDEFIKSSGIARNFYRDMYYDDVPDRVIEAMVRYPDYREVKRLMEQSDAYRYQYLIEEHGIQIKPVYEERPRVRGQFPWGDAAFDSWADSFDPELIQEVGTKEHREASRIVLEAIERQTFATKGLRADALMDLYRNGLFYEVDGEYLLLPNVYLYWLKESLVEKREFNNGKRNVDKRATQELIDQAMQGRDSDYRTWIDQMTWYLFDDPVMKLRGKNVPYNLSNIVDYMTSQPTTASEKNITFGPGAARSMGATQFSSIDEMHTSEYKLVPDSSFQSYIDNIQTPLRDQIMSKLNEKYKYDNRFEAYNDMFRAVGYYLKQWRNENPANMKKALTKYGFKNLTAEDVSVAVAFAEALREAPTYYFEAKPQRAIGFEEWSGAVVPENSGVIPMLKKYGIRFETYPEGDHAARHAAVEKISGDTDNVLFQDQGRDTWYFSQLEEVIEAKMPNYATPGQILGIIQGAVKKDEIIWTGFDDWLADQDGKVSKEDALNYLRTEGSVKIEEVVHGDPLGVTVNRESIVAESVFGNTEKSDERRYADSFLSIPGGEDYKELLITFADKERPLDRLIEGSLEHLSYVEHVNDIKYLERQGKLPQELLDYGAEKIFESLKEYKPKIYYQSPHWNEENVLAHIRMDTRTDVNGKRVLFIEEIQSDWHQAGRDKGYKNINTEKEVADAWRIISTLKKESERYQEIGRELNELSRQALQEIKNDDPNVLETQSKIRALQKERDTFFDENPDYQNAMNSIVKSRADYGKVPPAPFSKNWEELAIKRIIRYAAENGFDRVAWTSGEMQANRYQLRKHVEEIYYSGTNLVAYDKDGNTVIKTTGVREEDLPNYIGKEATEKLLAQPKEGTMRGLVGVDLELGGEGMRGFYDVKLPNIIKKYIKKWGGSLDQTAFGDLKKVIKTDNGRYAIVDNNGHLVGAGFTSAAEARTFIGKSNKGFEAQSFDITPSMRESVMNQGQPLFQNARNEYSPHAESNFLEDGRTIIRALNSPDISSLMHEIGHVFRRDLNDDQLFVVAQLGGIETVDEFRRLEKAFWNRTATPEEAAKYRKAEEKFARGWERYLAEGDAPTLALRSIFKQFTDWMLKIYKSLRRQDGRTVGFETQRQFVLDGEAVDIRAEINGISLRDIFDDLLTDRPNRAPDYDSIVSAKAEGIRRLGRNHRLEDAQLYSMARQEIVNDLFGKYSDIDEALSKIAQLENTDDPIYLSDGTNIEPVTVYDALKDAQEKRIPFPWDDKTVDHVAGNKTQARGIQNMENVYEFQFEVVDLDSIKQSHKWKGDVLELNPDYPPELQPRAREEKQSVLQIETYVNKFIPEALLYDYRSLDRGAPIVNDQYAVESGNGRILTLHRMLEKSPAKFDQYWNELDSYAAQYGIDPASYAGMKHPVLVRKRLSTVDPIAFVNDANKQVSMQMNQFEVASNDVRFISDDALAELKVLEGESIEQALQASRTRGFVNKFLSNFSVEELGQLSADGELSQQAIERIANAIFVKVYQGEEGERVFKKFAMDLDPVAASARSAMFASLPQLAKMESLIRKGQRNQDLSIFKDIAVAVDKLITIKTDGKMSVNDYVSQKTLFPGELDGIRMALLSFIGNQRHAKGLRELIREYSRLVIENDIDASQTSFLEQVGHTKEELLSTAIELTEPKKDGIFKEWLQEKVQEEPQPQAQTEETQPVQEIEPQAQAEELPEVMTPEGRESLEVLGWNKEEIDQIAEEIKQPSNRPDPWEFTLEEFLELDKSNRQTPQTKRDREFASLVHKNSVMQALENGKAVPENVLKDYQKGKVAGMQGATKSDRFYSYPEGLKGENDNRLVAYLHVREPSVKYSKYEGGTVDSYQSDWSRAEKCADCGRKIVHIFYVKEPNGDIKPYGVEHLHKALGRKKELTMAHAEKLAYQLRREQNIKDERTNVLLRRASKDKSEANQAFKQANNILEGSFFMVNDNQEYVRVANWRDENLLEEKGFKRYENKLEEQRFLEEARAQEAAENRAKAKASAPYDFVAGYPIALEDAIEIVSGESIDVESFPLRKFNRLDVMDALKKGEERGYALEYEAWLYSGKFGPEPEAPSIMIGEKVRAAFEPYMEKINYDLDHKFEVIYHTGRLTGKGVEVLKVSEDRHGPHLVRAKVYNNGVEVALLPTSINNEQSKFVISGVEGRLLGLDPANPDVWVYEIDGEIKKIHSAIPQVEEQRAPVTPAEEPRPKLKRNFENAEDWEISEEDYIIRRWLEDKEYLQQRVESWTRMADDAERNGSKGYARYKDNLNQVLRSLKHLEGKPADKMADYAAFYEDIIEEALRSGKPVPQEIIDTNEHFKKIVADKQASKPRPVEVDSKRLERGYHARRKDQKPLTQEQDAYIQSAMDEVQKVIGPIRNIMMDRGLIVEHTAGRLPAQARRWETLISVGVHASNTTAAEIGRFLDQAAGEAVGVRASLSRTSEEVWGLSLGNKTKLITEATKRMLNKKDVTNILVSRSLTEQQKTLLPYLKLKMGKYWGAPSAVWSRLFEMYIAYMNKDQRYAADSIERYYETPGYWDRATFESLVPEIRKEIDRRIEVLNGNVASETRAITIEDVVVNPQDLAAVGGEKVTAKRIRIGHKRGNPSTFVVMLDGQYHVANTFMDKVANVWAFKKLESYATEAEAIEAAKRILNESLDKSSPSLYQQTPDIYGPLDANVVDAMFKMPNMPDELPYRYYSENGGFMANMANNDLVFVSEDGKYIGMKKPLSADDIAAAGLVPLNSAARAHAVFTNAIANTKDGDAIALVNSQTINEKLLGMVIHQSVRDPQSIQITYFDPMGFTNDIQCRNMEEVLQQIGAARHLVYPGGEILQALVQSENFQNRPSLFQRTKKAPKGQVSLFAESNQDLPLFSGTPMRAQEEAFAPKEAVQQLNLFEVTPELPPERVIELYTQDEGFSSVVRLDIRRTKQIEKILNSQDGDVSYRILDQKGREIERGSDANEIINPRLFQRDFESSIPLTKSRRFEVFFRGSKAVDKYGNPVMVFQGTNLAYSYNDIDMAASTDIQGIYFTKDPKDAEMYAYSRGRIGANIRPAYLRILNPAGPEVLQQIRKENGWTRRENGKEITAELKRLGYDGIITPSEYIVFDALQIMSALMPSDEDMQDVARLYQDDSDNNEVLPDFVPGDTPEGQYPQLDIPKEVDPVQPPDSEPPLEYSEMADEINTDYLIPAIDEMRKEYKQEKASAFMGTPLPPEAQKSMQKYLQQVRGDMTTSKYGAIKHGDMKKDLALLNYSRRYGFDSILDIGVPYQFWYTRNVLRWMSRAFDKPKYFAAYAKIREMQEKLGMTGMPTRLDGKTRIPAPFLPDWMGGGLYFDPYKLLFPPASFAQPLEYYSTNRSRVIQTAESILRQQVDSNMITASDMEKALEMRSGALWDQAIKQAEEQAGQNTSPASLASMMLSPALYLSAPYHLLKGQPEKISQLPITRTAQAFRTALKGTPLESVGEIGGLIAKPEEALRDHADLSQFGEWGDYYVDRQISNMAAEGVITPDQALRAMMEKQGPAYDMAMQRVYQEQMLRTPGALTLQQLAQGNFDGAVQSLPSLFMGATLYPEGELKQRGIKQEYDAAWKEYTAGNKEALNEFWDEYPEYEARLALFAEPEERLRNFLVDEVWKGYANLEGPNKYKMIDAMGQEFELRFLNKDTRNYDGIPLDMLAYWAQTLKRQAPVTEETVPGMIEAAFNEPEQYDAGTNWAVQMYWNQKNEMFPGISGIQQEYYSLENKNERRRFLAMFPQLKQYWAWKSDYEENDPYVAAYNQEQREQYDNTVSPEALAQMNAILLRQLDSYANANRTLSRGAQEELYRIWVATGKPGESFENWLEEYVWNTFAGS